MSLSEQQPRAHRAGAVDAAASMASADLNNELLDKLDKSLRERAEKMVDEVLTAAIGRACSVVEDAMSLLLGRSLAPEVRNSIGLNASGSIRLRAVELTYRKLVDNTIAQLDGKAED